jgi:hypothetical protein
MIISNVFTIPSKSIFSFAAGLFFVSLYDMIFRHPEKKVKGKRKVMISKKKKLKAHACEVNLQEKKEISVCGDDILVRDVINAWRDLTAQNKDSTLSINVAEINGDEAGVNDDVIESVIRSQRDISSEGAKQMQDRFAPPKTCYICMGDEQQQLITLRSCGHSVHQDCIEGQLSAGWTGKRISFGFLSCGECRKPIAHKNLSEALAPHYDLKKKVEEICYSKCLEDNIIDDLESKKNKNYQKSMEECFNVLSCFICTVCNKPFSGGRMDCADDDDLDVSTIKCPSCAFDEVDQKEELENWRGKCRTHGYKYAMYKCDSCCSVATFDCRSNHYCSRCHNSAYSEKNYPCPGPDVCPLGIEHPPNQSAVHGEDRNEFIEGFVIGCYKCFTQSDIELDGFSNERQWADRF